MATRTSARPVLTRVNFFAIFSIVEIRLITFARSFFYGRTLSFLAT